MRYNYASTRLLIVLLSLFIANIVSAQHSNITISTAATSGGSFTGSAPARAFTVTADNAVINAAALVTELLTNNVTISTARSGGTQAGDIIFSSAVTSAGTNTTARTFTLIAGGSISVNAALNLTTASVSGNTAGYLATNITMTAGAGITFSAAVTTNGGNASSSGLTGSGGNGGSAGNITTSSATFSNSGTITAVGGNGSTQTLSFTARKGGAGGVISITATTSASIGNSINATGGGGVLGGNGGDGGAVTTTGNPGNLSITGAVTTNGGGGLSAGGGNISIRGTGGITLTGNITSAAGGVGSQGNLTINDGATTVTSGGTNDGQTITSVINVSDLTKTGNGNFNIAGVNTYTGNTTISAGTVRASSSAASGASTNGAFGNNNALGTATLTLTNATIEFNNATFTRAIVTSGSSRLDAYGAARSVSPAISGTGTLTIGGNTASGAEGQDLTLTGVISGSLALVKSFTSMLTLTPANTFTGAKTLNAGTLNVNNSSALGTVAGTFTIAGGTLDNTTAAAITTLAYIQTWSGDFSFTGTAALNLGAGAITMSASRQVTVNASTLTTGGAISASTLDLTKLGAGILHLGATAKTFRNVTISAGQLTSTSNILSIAGNFINNGIYAANAGTAVFNGTTQSISGTTATTAFSTLTVSPGSTTTETSAITAATFNLNSGGKFIQQAGTTIPGTTKNFVSGSKYELQAVGVTFSGATYGTLIINYASGNTSASGLLTSVLNDLIIQNTGTGSFRLSANTSPVITIAGKLQINAGKLNVVTGTGTPGLTINGDVELNGGTFQPMTSTGIPSIFVKGNWINNAAFTPGSSNVTFSSTTAPQNISGTSANTFYNLTNSNTDVSGLSLDADITVSNTLNLSSASNGIFSTGSNTVFVSNNATAAVTRPGTGYIVGNLKRTIATAGGTYDFPVGSFLGYTPASLLFNASNTAGNVNVTTTDGVSANYPSTLSSTNQLARTWTITNGGAGSFNANAVFTFLPEDLLNSATAANLKGYEFIAPPSYAYSGNTSPGSNTFSFNGFTSMGEFGAGECIGALQVTGIVTNVTCNSGSDGAITTTVSGNATPVSYLWNTTPVQTSADISNLVAGSYAVTVTEQTTCSASNSFTVTEPAAVPPPVSGGNQAVCSDGTLTQTLTATATSAVTVNWYTAPSGGTLVANPQQAGVGTVTYYAEAFDGTCSSLTRTPVTLTINPVPAAPAGGGDQIVCSNGSPTQTLTATATSPATITWYDAATNGNVVANPQQVGVGTSTYYAEANDGTCSSLTRTSVTLTINPVPAAPVSGGDQTVCSNGSPTQTLTAIATSPATVIWYDAATNGNIVANPQQVGVGTSTYYAEANDGTCNSLTRTAVTLTINPVPGAPVSGGDQTVCSNGSGTQTLTATATSPVTITWYDAATNGNVVANPQQVGVGSSTFYAEANDGTCSSLTRTAVILTINPVPATATVSVIQPTCATATGTITITAPTGTGFTYNIGAGSQPNPVFTAVPPGTYNNITVTNNFGCTSLLPASATVNPQPFTPSAPVISGIVNVCPYINTGTQLTYTATAAGATSFNWSIPANVAVVSGMGTGTLVVTFSTGFAEQAYKQFRVTATSICGTSPMTIFYLLAQYPSTPSPITGPANTCPYVNTGTIVTYTIPVATSATSYAWTVPSGAHIVSGQGTTSIGVTYDLGFAGGTLSVNAVNTCGPSGPRTLTLTARAASQPSPIAGPTNACPYMAPGGTIATYSTPVVNGAISYAWATPANTTVSHPNGTGTATDTVITVLYPAGFTSGTITVTATNGCGTSPARSLNITRLNPATPSVIDVIQTHFCGEAGGRVYTYTLSAMPYNANSIQWTVPLGATLVSGQGTISITVSYPDGAVNGNITAQAFSNCGSSSIRISVVKLPACPPPGFSGGGKMQSKVSAAVTGIMEVRVFPNPTVSDFKMEVLSSAKEEINVRVIDAQGRLYKTFKIMPYQTIALGAELKTGSYLLEVRQGKEVRMTKVVKF